MAVSRLSLILVLLAVLWSKAQSQEQACLDQTTCGGCIQTPNCVWCEDISFLGSRCSLDSFTSCQNVTDPRGEITNTEPAPENFAINPRTIELSLRPGSNDKRTFQVEVTALRNLPLDLYILMDLSGSMSGDLISVRAASTNILASLEDITNNARLGFGSFDDKPLRPFTFEGTGHDNLCNITNPERGERCPYAFLHRIPMTANITFFQTQIAVALTTISTDNPENGLEALAQVITCEDIMGWRDRSADGAERGLNRIVLLITDDNFHFSGEGRLAGIPWPYNGKCLLDPPNDPTDRVLFERWDEYDFPSVGEITALLAEYNVIPIFAIPNVTGFEPVLSAYQDLVQLINLRQRAVAAQLDEQSQNIVDILRQEIENLISTIDLTPNLPDGVDATFEIAATCPSGAFEIEDGQACDNVTLEQAVQFEVSITLNSCNDVNTNAPLVFPIEVVVNVVGYGDFTVFIDGICECECEQNVQVNSSLCNGNGNFVCGSCICNDPWCGPTCNFLTTDDPVCPNGIGGAQCSGLRGDCECICQCNFPDDNFPFPDGVLEKLGDVEPVIFGEACECDNFLCDITNGTVCSERGDCCEGECQCAFKDGSMNPLDQYLGENCECGTAREVCVDPNNNTDACNGVGECGCNMCVCETGYLGQYCEMIDPGSVTCSGGAMNCVLCEFGRISDCSMCPGRNFEVRLAAADQLETDEEIEALANEVFVDGPYNYSGRVCQFTSGDCTYEYHLVFNSNRQAIIAIDEEECTESSGFQLAVDVWVLAIIILAVLLVLGIVILILIKIIFVILDYIEVKKLEKEARGADFSKNQNPLYQSPEMKYENVLYGKPV